MRVLIADLIEQVKNGSDYEEARKADIHRSAKRQTLPMTRMHII